MRVSVYATKVQTITELRIDNAASTNRRIFKENAKFVVLVNLFLNKLLGLSVF